jgi:nitroimidazol reductase NimA-like FMN-containing flavoprotein (pyridoxamine 5'-phosphate oxidase superfamily)
MATSLRKTVKTSISRHPERGSYDRVAAYSILDEGMVAHVGFNSSDGVIVVPMTYARLGDDIVLHGAAASRWLSSFAEGRDVSVCVTLLDGLVLARSAFSHSMNYRSVVAFGRAVVIEDPSRKQAAFHALLDHLLPGRWDDCRQPDRKEIDATTVLSLRLDEASVKIRSGPPKDSAKDAELDYWAGVIPLALQAGDPVADAGNKRNRAEPGYAKNYSR